MKNKYLLCAGFLAHSAVIAADDTSMLQPFYMINKTNHYININLTFSGGEKLKDLILTSGSSIQLHRSK